LYFYFRYFKGIKGDISSEWHNAITIDEYKDGLAQAYRNDTKTFLGGIPDVVDVHCAYDWDAFLRPLVSPHFGGLGHCQQESFDVNQAYTAGSQSCNIHWMRIFNGEDGRVRMQYKISPVYETVLPENHPGVALFKPGVVFPQGPPPWAKFKDDKKWRKKHVFRTMKHLHDYDPRVVSVEQQHNWDTVIENVPKDVSCVKTEYKPVFLFPSQVSRVVATQESVAAGDSSASAAAATATDATVTAPSDGPIDTGIIAAAARRKEIVARDSVHRRSYLDGAPNPQLHLVTHEDYTRKLERLPVAFTEFKTQTTSSLSCSR
jgi:hypothetical protein